MVAAGDELYFMLKINLHGSAPSPPQPHHSAVSGKAPTSWFNKRCEHTISATVNTVLIRYVYDFHIGCLIFTNMVLKRML